MACLYRRQTLLLWATLQCSHGAQGMLLVSVSQALGLTQETCFWNNSEFPFQASYKEFAALWAKPLGGWGCWHLKSSSMQWRHWNTGTRLRASGWGSKRRTHWNAHFPTPPSSYIFILQWLHINTAVADKFLALTAPTRVLYSEMYTRAVQKVSHFILFSRN